ncbi:LOW QUALITY PROTEIN: titin-like, partial [Rhagoletis pomonella]|uniref:LOW QUALITY PROTEIN: titin-like n=1 Tax=Rhagoletis pomonella TaxID=28610 RepID=UPI0017858B3B
MGCDGGTIPRRDELVRTAKKPEQKDKDAEREFRWLHCALTQQRLQEPIVMCSLGRLYSKQSLIEQLLEKDKMPESIKHIRSLKDIKSLNLTPNPAYTDEDKTEGLLDTRHARYICKLSGLEMSGKFRFVALWTCGCVIAERAIKQIKRDNSGGSTCPLCLIPFGIEDVVILNAADEDLELMQAKMEMRNVKRKTCKKDKKEKKKSKPEKETKAATVAPVTAVTEEVVVPAESQSGTHILAEDKPSAVIATTELTPRQTETTVTVTQEANIPEPFSNVTVVPLRKSPKQVAFALDIDEREPLVEFAAPTPTERIDDLKTLTNDFLSDEKQTHLSPRLPQVTDLDADAKSISAIVQKVAEITITEQQPVLETTEPLNEISAIPNRTEQQPAEDASGVVKTTTVRKTKFVKKIMQKKPASPESPEPQPTASETAEDIDVAEEAKEEPKIEKSESVVREVDDSGVIKTTTVRTMSIKSQNVNEATEIGEATQVVEEKEYPPARVEEEHSAIVDTPDAYEIRNVLPTTEKYATDQTIAGEVVKTIRVRKTKTVKRITQNVEESSSEKSTTTASENTADETAAVEPTDEHEKENGGVVKTVTVRTTSFVRRIPYDSVSAANVCDETAHTKTSESPSDEQLRNSPIVIEEPSESSTTTTQTDGAIIKTTTIRTMRLNKTIASDGRILLKEVDNPDDVIVTSSIEMPEQATMPGVKTIDVSSLSEPLPTAYAPTESSDNVYDVPSGIDEVQIIDSANSEQVESKKSTGIEVVDIDTKVLPNVEEQQAHQTQQTSITETTRTTSDLTITNKTLTTQSNEQTSKSTTTVTKRTRLTTLQRASVETQDGEPLTLVDESYNGLPKSGEVRKIALITHEETYKTPKMKMHFDFPPVTLKVTETLTTQLENTAESSEGTKVVEEEVKLETGTESIIHKIIEEQVTADEVLDECSNVKVEEGKQVSSVTVGSETPLPEGVLPTTEAVTRLAEPIVIEKVVEKKDEIIDQLTTESVVEKRFTESSEYNENTSLATIVEGVSLITVNNIAIPDRPPSANDTQKFEKLAEPTVQQTQAADTPDFVAEMTAEEQELFEDIKKKLAKKDKKKRPALPEDFFKQEQLDRTVELLAEERLASKTSEVGEQPEAPQVGRTAVEEARVERSETEFKQNIFLDLVEDKSLKIREVSKSEETYHELVEREVPAHDDTPIEPKAETQVEEEEVQVVHTKLPATAEPTNNAIANEIPAAKPSASVLIEETSAHNSALICFEVPKYNLNELQLAEKSYIEVSNKPSEPQIVELSQKDEAKPVVDAPTKVISVVSSDIPLYYDVPKYDVSTLAQAEVRYQTLQENVKSPEVEQPAVSQVSDIDEANLIEKVAKIQLGVKEDELVSKTTTTTTTTVTTKVTTSSTSEEIADMQASQVKHVEPKLELATAVAEVKPAEISESFAPAESKEESNTDKSRQSITSTTILTTAVAATASVLESVSNYFNYETPKYNVEAIKQAEKHFVDTVVQQSVDDQEIVEEKAKEKLEEVKTVGKPLEKSVEEVVEVKKIEDKPIETLKEEEKSEETVSQGSSATITTITTTTETVEVKASESKPVKEVPKVVEEEHIAKVEQAKPADTPAELPAEEVVEVKTIQENPVESVNEAPKKPAYAGLPIDESSSIWMDVLDEPMVLSDEDEKSEETVTQTTTTMTTKTSVVTEVEETKTLETKTVEEISQTVEEKLMEQVGEVKPVEIPVEPIAEVTNVVKEKQIVKAEEVQSVVAPDEEIIEVKTIEEKPVEIVKEEPKKPVYAGLPIDESSTTWMDVLDEPMVFSDEEDKPEETVSETTTTTVTETTAVIEVEEVEASEPKSVQDAPQEVEEKLFEKVEEVKSVETPVEEIIAVNTVEKKPIVPVKDEPKKPTYAGLPIDESSTTWMDVLDEPMVFSDEEENSQETVTQTTTTTVTKTTVLTEVEEVKSSETSSVKDIPQVVEDKSIEKVVEVKPVQISAEPVEEVPKLVEEKPFEKVEEVNSVEIPLEEVIEVKTVEEKPVEPIKEEPKKPAYAGLPIDESSTTWMDVLDEPIVLSDEEDNSEETVTQATTTTVTKTTVVTEVKEVETSEISTVKDIPQAVVDKSIENVVEVKPVQISAETVEEVPKLVEEKPFEKVEEVKSVEIPLEEDIEVKTVEEKPVEPIKEEPKKPAYAGLPIDESSTTWMDVMDEPMVLSDEEENSEETVMQTTTTTVTKTTVATEVKQVETSEINTVKDIPQAVVDKSIEKVVEVKPVQISAEPVEEVPKLVEEKPFEKVEEVKAPEIPLEEVIEVTTVEEKPVEPTKEEAKKPAYAGLPIDESSTTWMDVLDEPMVLSDEEETSQETVSHTTTTTTVVSEVVEVKPAEPKLVETVSVVTNDKPIEQIEDVKPVEETPIKPAVVSESVKDTETIGIDEIQHALSQITTITSSMFEAIEQSTAGMLAVDEQPKLPTVMNEENIVQPVDDKTKKEKVVSFVDEVKSESTVKSANENILENLEIKTTDTFAPYENVPLAPEITAPPVDGYGKERSISESDLLIVSKWSDSKPLPEEKSVIDTWSSVLEDTTPVQPNIAFTSKLSPNAPEFTPSYLRQTDADENVVFLENERSVHTEKVQKKSKQQKREEKSHKEQPEEKISERPSQLNADAPVFKLPEDTRDSKAPKGKSYADIVFSEHSHVGETSTIQAVTEDKKVPSEKPAEPEVTPVEQVKRKDEPQKKTKKEKRKAEKVEKVVKIVETMEKEVPENITAELEEEKPEPAVLDEPQKEPQKELETTRAPLMSWSSIVKTPGEWVDDIVSKTKKVFTESEKKATVADKKSAKEVSKEKPAAPEKERKPKKSKKNKNRDVSIEPAKPEEEEEPVHKPTKAEEVKSTESDESDELKENSQSPITSEEENHVAVEAPAVPENIAPKQSQPGIVSWASLVSRPGEWIDETITKHKAPSEPLPKVEKPKPLKTKEKENKDKKPKSKPERISKKTDTHIEEQTEWTEVVATTDAVAEIEAAVSKVVEKPEPQIETKEPVAPANPQFSWAALVKRPGEWVDDIKERKKAEKVAEPEQIVVEAPKKSEKFKKPKPVSKKVKERTEAPKESTQKDVSLPTTSDSDSERYEKLPATESNTLTWAKIASQKEVELKDSAQPKEIVSKKDLKQRKEVSQPKEKPLETLSTKQAKQIKEMAQPKEKPASKPTAVQEVEIYSDIPAVPTKMSWATIVSQSTTDFISNERSRPTSKAEKVKAIPQKKQPIERIERAVAERPAVEVSAHKETLDDFEWNNFSERVTSTYDHPEDNDDFAGQNEPKSWKDMIDEDDDLFSYDVPAEVQKPTEEVFEKTDENVSNVTSTITTTTTVVSETKTVEEVPQVVAEKRIEKIGDVKPAETIVEEVVEVETVEKKTGRTSKVPDIKPVVKMPEVVEEKPLEKVDVVKPIETSVEEVVERKPVEEKPVEPLKEEPNKPAYAGLPIDESSTTWMDVLDEPMFLSDEEENSAETVTSTTTTTTITTTVVSETEKNKESETKLFEEVPQVVDEKSIEKFEQIEPVKSPVEPIENVPKVVEEIAIVNAEEVQSVVAPVEEKIEVKSVEEKPVEAQKEEPKKPAIDESSITWMNVLEEPLVLSNEEETVSQITTTTTTTVITESQEIKAPVEEVLQEVKETPKENVEKEKPVESAVDKVVEVKTVVEKPFEPAKEEPKKPAYEGLPIDESSSTWVDVLDHEPVKEEPKKPAYAGLPIDGSSSTWLDVLDEPMFLSDEEDTSQGTVSQTTATVTTTSTIATEAVEVKTPETKPVETAPQVVEDTPLEKVEEIIEVKAVEKKPVEPVKEEPKKP